MSKQIKIGFDKVPAPVTKQYPQLVDIQGQPLFDAAGNPLLTEEDATLGSFSLAENSLSNVLATESLQKVTPIVEQFPNFSESSTSLLGVERAEKQLSLFSDVSTYGIDNDNWNFYRYRSGRGDRFAWSTRENVPFGRRSETQLIEKTEEQALVLRSFPVQFSYPWGPEWEKNGVYNAQLHDRYMNFIAIGKILFDLFKDQYLAYAEQNFISDRIQIVDEGDNNIVPIDKDGLILQDSVVVGINGAQDFYKVDYGDDEDLAYREIESFTKVFQKIQNNTIAFPELDQIVEGKYENTEEFQALRAFINAGQARPGYYSNEIRFGILESNESFRYQPGRISGFTFGIRMKNNPASSSSVIEWGAANDTDQYVFQLKGTEFNIVRRSVLPFSDELLERQGLRVTDQQLVFPYTVENNNTVITDPLTNQIGTHYETVISRNRFNGDPLNGSGSSGYFLDFESVTMFKIEFSWYGAIGAKFYAYIPIRNGEARWVLIHTLVIENGMGEPILRNPNMKFRYLLFNQGTESLDQPTFIYKYGSSYYIDGGDEGTIQTVSQNTIQKSFNNRTPLIGVMPKNNILNFDGVPISNSKKIYPTTISVSSDEDVRIDVEEIIGSPSGHHFYYAPTLRNNNNESKENVPLRFNLAGNRILTDDESIDFSDPFYRNAKIIADGVYNCYIDLDTTDPSNQTALLFRRNSSYELVRSEISQETQKVDGTTFQPRLSETFNAKITSYSTIAASDIPISSSIFRIHFLNPSPRDDLFGNRHYADFLFTISNKKPELDGEGKLVFDTEPIDLYDNLYVEYSNNEVSFDIEGRENRERIINLSPRMEVDYRLPNPLGGNSGDISTIQGEFRVVDFPIESVQPSTDFPGEYVITFVSGAPEITQEDIDRGDAEVGVNNQGSGVFYKSTVFSIGQRDNGDTIFAVRISGDIGNPSSIQTKLFRLSDNWNIRLYRSNGERVTSGNFLYTRLVPFDYQPPVYPVFALKDQSEIRNIVIEEVFPQSNQTHTPSWITEQPETIVEENGASSEKAPSNFVSDERLTSSRFDITTTQPLRPGNIIYSFFVGKNNTETIDLSNVFNFDRKKILPALNNNRAYFFNANSLNAGGGNIQMTLTVKEQG